jgi:peptidoglycan hydrolase-like protein with peptidoglycan-binding domain/LysM repeat protein
MFCERTRRARGWLAGLLVATVLLCVPASGVAADPAPADAELSAAGTLARGAGYASRTGAQPVRELQRRLRRLGDRPGPIDGLYGPLTEGAVERFQRAHGLATDGVVGPQTKRRLLAQRAERPVADTSRPTHTGQLARKSPSGGNPDESATEQHPARSAPTEALSRAGPPSSEGVPPELLALLTALAAGALLLALRMYGRRAREATINFGMVCAALLAMFVIGAATGAVFATQSAPDTGGETFADSGALLAARSAPSHPATGELLKLGRVVQTRRPRPVPTARRPAPRAQVAVRPARRRSSATVDSGPAPLPHEPQDFGQRPRAAPARSSAAPARPPVAAARPTTSTYTVRPGDALWPIARRHLSATSTVAQVARKVEDLKTLNIDRIASGDPNVLKAGEELRLR